MHDEGDGSVTHWIDGLRAGDSLAAQELWNRYFRSLVAVAQSRLREFSGDASGEDVALSAMKSVMLGVRIDRFPDLADRTELWPLLVTVTARKSIDQVRRQTARKRNPAAVEPLSDLRRIVGNEPTPQFAIELADELERLVLSVGDPTLRQIAQRKLEGCTNEDIADELGVSTRTVIRKLKRVRQEWEHDALGKQQNGSRNDV